MEVVADAFVTKHRTAIFDPVGTVTPADVLNESVLVPLLFRTVGRAGVYV